MGLEGEIIKAARDQFFDYLFILHEAPRTRKVSLCHLYVCMNVCVCVCVCACV